MGGKKGDGGMGHSKIPDFQDLDSHSKGAHQETSKREAHEERVHSNATASTSLRCGFQWLRVVLDSRLHDWMDEYGFATEDFDPTAYYWRHIEVSSSCLKHVIGRGGRTLRKIESFAGVFAFVEDTNKGPQIALAGCPRACILAEFLVEMLEGSNYSIMESLVEHGF